MSTLLQAPSAMVQSNHTNQISKDHCQLSTVDSKKLEHGRWSNYAPLLLSLGFGVEGRLYSNFELTLVLQLWASTVGSFPTVGSKKLEHGCRMRYAGFPSFLGLGSKDGHVLIPWRLLLLGRIPRSPKPKAGVVARL